MQERDHPEFAKVSQVEKAQPPSMLRSTAGMEAAICIETGQELG